MKPGSQHRIVLRVDDTPHNFKLEGKQGYGRAAGIWQTVYLEARPQVAIQFVHFTPDIDQEKVTVHVKLDQAAPEELDFLLKFKKEDRQPETVYQKISKGKQEITFDIPLKNPRLWSLEDPYLYQLKAILTGKDVDPDTVSTYFGMRKISVVNLPGTDIPYIALNNKPIYLKMCLDQSYHPEGFYTFPSDSFMRDEILRTRRLGLNGQRIHIKVEIPRKLYWADRLGILIMADVPNWWGPPTPEAKKEWEYALRNMIERDFNHPAIFCWVNFNETWGLRTNRKYLPETQKWVESMFKLTKKLDPTRLVEDNSPNKEDHVITDLNSWHAYLPGYAWREKLDQVSDSTFPGSPWNFVKGKHQDRQPMMNSECGNVWGYKGSTGDVDWSWDYHIMMNEFRRHPRVCGWLYTEHHDVINEWNGYYRYNRSQKFTGLSDIFPGMKLNDLHGPFYIASERELCRQVKPGETINVPLFASFLTDQQLSDSLILRTVLFGWNNLGQKKIYSTQIFHIPYSPWMTKKLKPISIKMPDETALTVLGFSLEDPTGTVLHRNFTTYLVADGSAPRTEKLLLNNHKALVIRFSPVSFKRAEWSQKQWNILNGLKVNGTGYGYFEYEIPWPSNLKVEELAEVTFIFEASAKRLNGKDRPHAGKPEGNYMRGKGTHDPSLNPNSYPMTDEEKFPTSVCVRINGEPAGVFDLSDDPADHRGILSWFSQLRDGRLREAGSYGDLIRVNLPYSALVKAAQKGTIRIRLEVDDSLPGGLAIYGERFGRYPVDPTLIFVKK